MITATFEGKKLVINLTSLEEEYKKNGEKIIFTLFYGSEYIGSSGNGDSIDSYNIEGRKEINYSGEEKVIIELNEIKDGYRGNAIFIGYYLEVNFGKKFFIFKDSKDIDIKGRENVVYKYNNLKINNKEFFNKIDKYSYKKILINTSIIRKIILLLSVGGIIGGAIGLFLTYYNTWFVIIISIAVGAITLFTAGKNYIDCELKKDIVEGDSISSVIKGKIKLDLEELDIQLFALNSEKGNYEVDSGSTTRTVRFNTQVGNILLYETKLKDIKAGANLENYINGKLNFSKIYENLFPSIEITNRTGLFVSLELRIKSKNYKDFIFRQDLLLSNDKFTRKPGIIKQDIIVDANIDTKDKNLNSDFFV